MSLMTALFQYTGNGGTAGNQSFMLLFNVILIIYGAYSVYSGNKMKKTLEPMQWLMTSEERMRARKPKSFCRFMAPKTRLFGVLCMIYGLFGIVSDKVVKIPFAEGIVLAAFVVCIIWFFVTLKRAKKKYI